MVGQLDSLAAASGVSTRDHQPAGMLAAVECGGHSRPVAAPLVRRLVALRRKQSEIM